MKHGNINMKEHDTYGNIKHMKLISMEAYGNMKCEMKHEHELWKHET
jgi:hypothetical protein